MQDAPDTDTLWQRGAEAISEARDLIDMRKAYVDEAMELAYQRLSSANASMAFVRRIAYRSLRSGLLSMAEDER